MEQDQQNCEPSDATSGPTSPGTTTTPDETTPPDAVNMRSAGARGWATRARNWVSPTAKRAGKVFSPTGFAAVGAVLALWQSCVTQRGLDQIRAESRGAERRARYQALDSAILTVGDFQRVLGDCLQKRREVEECSSALYDLRAETRAAARDPNLAIHYPDIYEWMNALNLFAETRNVPEAVRTLALLRMVVDRAEDQLRGPSRITDEGLRGPPRARRLWDTLASGDLQTDLRLLQRFPHAPQIDKDAKPGDTRAGSAGD
ncbi:MAG: hypothetical protein WKG01_05545 [Kofleriaceae bacterium]